MIRSVNLRVRGVPSPQGSKTAFIVNGRAVLADGRRGPARKAHADWRQAIKEAAADRLRSSPWIKPFDQACAVHITFLLPRPASVKRRWPDVRPDLDKLERALLDGIADGGLITNDAKVVEIHSKKLYAPEGVDPGASVTVHLIGQQTAQEQDS